MQNVQEVFDTRLAEVEQFIKFVRRMQAPGTVGKLGLARQNECIPMLKACIFLLLYNAVESCVRSTFSDVYDQIKASNSDYSAVTPAMKKIWITQQLDAKISPASANRDTYLGAVSSIAEFVAASTSIEFSARDLPLSGNLDADQIRDLCRKHGIVLRISAWAKGGVELGTIKSKRNALAHGHVSFVECGREYGLDDLERMLRQTKHFMKGLLKSVAKFTASTAYKLA